jgi:hypothetical protein
MYDAHGTGLLVDFDFADLGAVGEGDRGRREGRGLTEPGLQAGRELLRLVGGARHGGQRHDAVGAGHREPSVAQDDVRGRRFHQVGGDAAAALDDLLRRARHRRSADAEGARATIAPTGAEGVRVAPEHLNALGGHAQPVAYDLRERRLSPGSCPAGRRRAPLRAPWRGASGGDVRAGPERRARKHA